jgi:hypothetical protein
MSVTMPPIAYHMLVTSCQSAADLLLAFEAERWASAAAGSGSAASAVGSQLHAFVSQPLFPDSVQESIHVHPP